jgi:putative glutamine amidotransferase
MTHIVGGYIGGYYPQLFSKEIKHIVSPKQLVDNYGTPADLMVLWGGEDISPCIYGELPHRAYSGSQTSKRDKCEINLVRACKQLDIPILAICRGAQLVCAMGGGALYQHVDNHEGCHHEIVMAGGQVYQSNSAHHQVMIPGKGMEVIAVAKCRSDWKYRNSNKPIQDDSDEVEILYIPEFRCLGIQGHPEWLSREHDLVKLTHKLTKEYLHVEL